MYAITEFLSNSFLCLLVCISIGYVVGRFSVKKFMLGNALGTLIAGIVISYLGGVVDIHQKQFYFSLYIFAIGYANGDNVSKMFNINALKGVFLAIIMLLVSCITLFMIEKYFQTSKGLLVGIAAGGLTQSTILETASDALSGVAGNMTAAQLNIFNADVVTGFSISYVIGVFAVIIWCVICVEVIFGRKIGDEAQKINEHHGADGKLSQHIHVSVSDGIFVLCNGLIIGCLLGFLHITIYGVTIKLGSIGCLLAGLWFGWFNVKHPTKLFIPEQAIRLLRGFCFSAFLAVVSISSGRAAIDELLNNGWHILLPSVIIALVPLIICTFIAYFIFRYKNIALLSGALAGIRLDNSTVGMLTVKAGNNVPMLSFTIAYICSNILLSLLGPIIIMWW